MSDTIDPATGTTPEPVLRNAAVQSIVTGVTTAAVALGAVFAPGVDLSGVQEATLGTSAAVVILVNAVATAYTAWRARQRVKPLVADLAR